jgi:hypothetical protein
MYSPPKYILSKPSPNPSLSSQRVRCLKFRNYNKTCRRENREEYLKSRTMYSRTITLRDAVFQLSLAIFNRAKKAMSWQTEQPKRDAVEARPH